MLIHTHTHTHTHTDILNYHKSSVSFYVPITGSGHQYCSLYLFSPIPGSSDSKESSCNAGNVGLIPGSGRFLEKEMATHSSILAKKFHGQRSLVGYSPWGHKELNTTEQITYFNLSSQLSLYYIRI